MDFLNKIDNFGLNVGFSQKKSHQALLLSKTVTKKPVQDHIRLVPENK